MAEAPASNEQNTESSEPMYSGYGSVDSADTFTTGKALRPPPGNEPGPLDLASVRSTLPSELLGKTEIVGNYRVETYKVLGTGAFGVVSPATDSKGNKVAAKKIALTDKRVAKISKDLEKLRELEHPHIVKIFDIHQVEAIIWIFLEYCAHGDLNNFFRKTELTNIKKLEIMLQIALGVEYLHNRNIIHRDIKPANTLVSCDNPVTLKLTDFDCSKHLEPNYDTSRMSTNVGTPAFKAPEFFANPRTYHRNVDMFSMGLTYLALIQGNYPLIPHIETPDQDSELHECIGQLLAQRIKYKKKPLEIIATEDDSILSKVFGLKWKAASAETRKYSREIIEVRKLIRQMTHVKPEERISATEVTKSLRKILEKVCTQLPSFYLSGFSEFHLTLPQLRKTFRCVKILSAPP